MSKTPKTRANCDLKIAKFTEKCGDTVAKVMKNVVMKFQSNPLTHFQDTST